jgi:hypothetical protein
MPDDAKSPDVPRAQLGTAEDLKEVWDRFRAGDVVYCPSDAAPLALAVDGSAGAYRFVCTQCGLASPWFESGPNGMRVRSHASTGSGQPAPDD